jgi:hypothetical protein
MIVIRYLLAIGSVIAAALIIHEGVTEHKSVIWPLFVLPPLFALNAFVLVATAARRYENRLGRIIKLWFEVKEADLRARLPRTKSSEPDK